MDRETKEGNQLRYCEEEAAQGFQERDGVAIAIGERETASLQKVSTPNYHFSALLDVFFLPLLLEDLP